MKMTYQFSFKKQEDNFNLIQLNHQEKQSTSLSIKQTKKKEKESDYDQPHVHDWLFYLMNLPFCGCEGSDCLRTTTTASRD